ncbi:UvrD-helicase domain-containing protein [Candidatus Saccharibacteria bacterium]|nr:UvrD-helicase domain-containing protein [Candidatus Saccharibacteria bacterium]
MKNPEYRADLDAFLRYLCSYITQFKNSLYDFCQFRAAIRAQGDRYARCRSRAFLRLFQPVFNAYQRQLEHTRSYDFADMINDASRAVQEIPECAANYRYVLLDEAQDLSPNRSQLIRAILHKNPSCRFFAVGDDWQSIYRFTGSNLALIHDFENAFGLHTRRSLIEQTHRFGQPTIKLSSRFIMKNPTQVSKDIRGSRHRCTPIQIVLSERKGDDTDALLQILAKITDLHDVQIISRYNHDIRRIKERSGLRVLGVDSISWRGQKIPFCSIHKSKGITRDYVVVLNMNATPTGMPATRENDPLSDFLLSTPDDFMFAEERRLFYVAITRARKASFLIAERCHPSLFLYEISDDLAELYQKLCPRCQIGELRRKGNISYCTNYRYGCSYIQRYHC